MTPSFPGKEFLRSHSHLYRYLYRLIYLWLYKEDLNAAPVYGGEDEEVVRALTSQEMDQTREILVDFWGQYRAFKPDGVLIVLSALPWERQVHEGLLPLAGHESIIYLDMFEESNAIPRSYRMLSYDPHPTEIVHQLIASNLYKVIQGLVGSN